MKLKQKITIEYEGDFVDEHEAKTLLKSISGYVIEDVMKFGTMRVLSAEVSTELPPVPRPTWTVRFNGTHWL